MFSFDKKGKKERERQLDKLTYRKNDGRKNVNKAFTHSFLKYEDDI